MRITRKHLNNIIVEEIMNVVKEADLGSLPTIDSLEDNPAGGLAAPGIAAAQTAIIQAQSDIISAQIDNLVEDEDLPIDEATREGLVNILKLTLEELENLRDRMESGQTR